MASPPPPPLRTARESFPSSGSSLSNAPHGTRCSPPAKAENTFTIPAWYRHTCAGGRTSRANERLPSFACPLKRLAKSSRDERPGGSRPAFARGDLARGLNPYPPDYRTAFASSPILYPPSRRRPPRGGPTPRGGRRAYHVPRMNHGWCRLCLSAGGSDDDDRGWEIPLYLATYLLVQASQRLWLVGSHDVYQQFT